VEQLLARSVADSEARDIPTRAHPLRDAGRIQLVLALAFAAAALALRGPLQDGLLGGSATLYWVLFGAVLAYSGSYFARGVLSGQGRFGAYGGLLLLESCTRVTFALAVAVGAAGGASLVALGMAVGPAVSLAVVLAAALAWRARGRAGAPASGRAGPVAPAVDSPGEPEFTMRRGAGYAGGVLAIMACEQAFLNAGPVLVNATEPVGGAALAGFVFNALLIVRAPLQLFQAVSASILPHLTRVRARGRTDAFAHGVSVTLRAIAGFSAIVALALLAAGPPAMDLLFGGGFEYGRGGLALLGLAMGLYLAASTLTQAALARGWAAAAAARWAAGAAVFVFLLVLPSAGDRVLQVELAFAAAALVLCLSMLQLHRAERPAPNADVPG
jgi:O-antigen/teichoic acid export membrane protein